ncbi:MAG TPA: isovaleryl-CoA dehydrogenase [Stellaceae bacterium]|nr:isovaleryl-CoA dehydrogenase [Stellaceae bacterium]
MPADRILGAPAMGNGARLNQPPPLVDYNLFTTDAALREAVTREGAQWAAADLTKLGAELGLADTLEWGAAANRHTPELHSFDRYGQRRDEVEFHPAWHRMLALAVAHGLHTSPWAAPQPGAHVARAAGAYMLTQVESGVYCPVAMTYGAVPTVRREAALAQEWLPRLYSRRYDERFRPAPEKTGALMGMGMTEKQGGSDLRANVSCAEPSGEGDRSYRITGHKWFLSAPMCDAFLMLAQTAKGPTCFLVPRWCPDGTRNGLHLQRLKEKLGNRSNASSEVELVQAWARIVGDEGRGIPIIIEMSNHTRLDCAVSSAGLIRQATVQAIHHARHRTAFQRRLVDQPVMANVLAELALESEAATALAFRLVRAYDRLADPAEALLARLLTPIAKYWNCKRAPAAILEALEVLGGNGYVEESNLPRLYREAPVNAVWEGSANIICLDVRRVAERTPEAVSALLDELRRARGGHAALDAHLNVLDADLAKTIGTDESQARRVVGGAALALQAALLVQHAPPELADAFCRTRLVDGAPAALGTLPSGLDFAGIIERAMPS